MCDKILINAGDIGFTHISLVSLWVSMVDAVYKPTRHKSGVTGPADFIQFWEP